MATEPQVTLEQLRKQLELTNYWKAEAAHWKEQAELMRERLKKDGGADNYFSRRLI